VGIVAGDMRLTPGSLGSMVNIPGQVDSKWEADSSYYKDVSISN
jgi:hypothetical protein